MVGEGFFLTFSACGNLCCVIWTRNRAPGELTVDMFGEDRHQVLRLRQRGFKGDA